MKKKIVILFGGQSSEHDISCISATTIIENIDKTLYDCILIGITKKGKWLKVEDVESIRNNSWIKGNVRTVISPDATDKAVLIILENKVEKINIDIAIPVLHGLCGEDGTIQGLFEMAKIPYVGCGVLSSAIAMDKVFTKIVVDTLGIHQAKYVAIHTDELENIQNVILKIEEKLSYPVFIKPSNAGSSKGVSKANNKEELVKSLIEAAKHDDKILVEETITGRELECAVIGGKEIKSSMVGEILASAEFYDFDAKYNSEESRTVIAPTLPEGIAEEIKMSAVKIFKAIDGSGLSRVDFFLEDKTNKVIFNEINTFPGFTSISMYPMLWEAAGIPIKELLKILIDTAHVRSNIQEEL